MDAVVKIASDFSPEYKECQDIDIYNQLIGKAKPESIDEVKEAIHLIQDLKKTDDYFLNKL